MTTQISSATVAPIPEFGDSAICSLVEVFSSIFSDGFIAVWLLTLLYLYHRWVGFLNHDQTRQRELQTQ